MATDIQWGYIFNYYVPRTSMYTGEQFRCFKALEAYVYHYDGWVQEVYSTVPNNDEDVVVLRANVRASQRSSLHKSWLLVKKSGEIITAHCSCMAE